MLTVQKKHAFACGGLGREHDYCAHCDEYNAGESVAVGRDKKSIA
jgi:hypothetical protein